MIDFSKYGADTSDDVYVRDKNRTRYLVISKSLFIHPDYDFNNPRYTEFLFFGDRETQLQIYHLAYLEWV